MLHRLRDARRGAGRGRLSASNEYAIVRQRLSGVRNAVVEFVEDRDGRWSLEIVSMPSRGEYQGEDYSLAVLSRTTAEDCKVT